MSNTKKPAEGMDLIQRVKDRFKQVAAATERQRERSAEEVAFCDPENQWEQSDRDGRRAKGIPCLVVDRMTPFLDQVANDQRMNRQAIDVHPVDDGADVKTAEVIKGLIRHIEYDSNADFAYDTAFMSVLRGGFGFIRLFLDYCNPESFEQDIKIGRVPNPFEVFLDPNSVEPDGSDADWAIVLQDISREEYKERYPDSELSKMSAGEWRSVGNDQPEWVGKESVRIVEYFEKVRTKRTICQLEDGSVVDAKDVPDGVPVTAKRQSYKTEVKHYVINAVEKLAETTFPGEYIPVIPVYGQELIIDGERQYTGLVRRLMDVQKMVNYWKSAQTHLIALSPKAPWIGPRGFRGDMEREWNNANREAYATLEYEPVIIQGQVMPPPMRNVQEPAIGAITAALAGTEEDLKAVTGMYDPALGNRGESGQSGVAIRALQHQGQAGNFHFADNLSRSLRHLGRIIVNILPKIYDTPRTLRIIGVDDEQKMTPINQPTGEVDPETGEPLIYDLTTGKYDVVVTSGPSYATRRQENLAVMMDLLRTLPPPVAVNIADLLAAQMDTPVAKEVAERLKKMIPPELTQDENKGGPQIPPKVQQQMQQMAQQLQALNAYAEQTEQQAQALQSQIADLEMQKKGLEMQAKSKEGDLYLKGQELQMDSEIEQAKLVLEGQKLALEAQKLKIEEMRLTVEAMQRQEQPEPAEAEKSEEPDGDEQPQGISREDLAMLFQAQLAAFHEGFQALAAPQPMPAQVIRLERTPGGITGTVSEAGAE